MAAPIFDGTVGDRLHNMTGKKPKKFSGGDVGTVDDEDQRQFRQILKEVEALGNSQLEWKQRKALEQKRAESLGAKPKKGFKTPIEMGLNIKRKRAEAEKTEELLAGLGRNKSRRTTDRFKERPQDRGLMASEGVFRGGVLYVKPTAKRAIDNAPSSSHTEARTFRGGKGKKGKKGKGKKKGKSGKKGGGKRR